MNNDPHIQLRDATITDSALLLHWASQAHVLAAGIEDWLWDKELSDPQSWRRQFIAELQW